MLIVMIVDPANRYRRHTTKRPCSSIPDFFARVSVGLVVCVFAKDVADLGRSEHSLTPARFRS